MSITTCLYCHKEFEAIRISRKFCSNSCRTQANMQRRKEEEEALITEQPEIPKPTPDNVFINKRPEGIKPQNQRQDGFVRFWGHNIPQEVLNQFFIGLVKALST